MGQDANYSGYAGERKASLTIGLEIFAYALRSDRRKDFITFYNKEIRSWLQEKCIAHAHAWIVDDYLIILSSPKMRPWSGIGGIPHLEEYLEHTEPVAIHGLEPFTLSPRAGTSEEYPVGKSA